MNIIAIGKIFINKRKINFLSLRLNLNLIFFANNKIKNTKGINIPNCLIAKIIGNFIWSIIFDCSKLVLWRPYLIVINSFWFSQIKCGTKIIKKISNIIKYLKSNFLIFRTKIRYINNRSIEIRR